MPLRPLPHKTIRGLADSVLFLAPRADCTYGWRKTTIAGAIFAETADLCYRISDIFTNKEPFLAYNDCPVYATFAVFIWQDAERPAPHNCCG